MPQQPQKLQAAAVIADRAAPYLAQFRASMAMVRSDRVPTIAADKAGRIYYNPDFVEKRTAADLAYILLHEIGHVLRRHHERAAAQAAEPQAWNIAADCEVNEEDWPGIARPADAITAEYYKWPARQLAETYYILMQTQQGQQGNQQGQQGNQQGQQGQGQPADHNGSATDGRPRPWELPEDDPDEPGRTALEMAAARQQAAHAAEEYSRAQGNGAGSAARWIDEELRPRGTWRQRLRHAIAAGTACTGTTRQTYQRTRRRGDCIFPRRNGRRPKICAIVDTSGSMRDCDVARAAAECVAMAQQCGALSVIWCDTVPTLQRHVTSRTQMQPRGGGGTDPAPALAMADEFTGDDRPDVIITITDGYCTWPSKAPRARHIAILLRDETQAPTWGESIRITE